MQDKVVVGSQDDALRGLTRFSDNEGDIIWPAWRAELKQRVAFEFGKIGNQIIEGEVKESDTANGEVTVNIHALINALIPKTRAQIQTRSDWMEEIVSSSAEAADVEGGSTTATKLTLIGKMSIARAISKIKSIASNAICQAAAESRPVTIFFSFEYCKQQQSSQVA